MTDAVTPPKKRGGAREGAGRKSSKDEDTASSVYEVYKKAQAKREVHNANIAELEERARRGDLVPVAEVRQQAVQAARAVREAMLALPSRLSAILADQPEPVVRERMTTEIRKMLEVIADTL